MCEGHPDSRKKILISLKIGKDKIIFFIIRSISFMERETLSYRLQLSTMNKTVPVGGGLRTLI
jgi:hypothetical protein